MAEIGTRKIKIEIDGDEFTAEMSNARFTTGGADTDFVTFAVAASGGAREYRFQGTAVQDTATVSLWTKVFSELGTEVPVTLMPHGNATPTVSEPHYTAMCTIEEADGDLIGGEANTSKTARQTIEINWPCDAKPTPVTS